MEDNNKHFTKAMWIIMVISIIVIVGLGIFAAVGLNYNFPDVTKLLPL
ncbi:MAG: hypothetical protein ACYCSQ_08325 [bacterium]